MERRRKEQRTFCEEEAQDYDHQGALQKGKHRDWTKLIVEVTEHALIVREQWGWLNEQSNEPHPICVKSSHELVRQLVAHTTTEAANVVARARHGLENGESE